MKKIAITARLIENNTYFELRNALDIRWAKLFSELNVLPIPLLTGFDFEKYINNGLYIDAIILSGGNDLNSQNPNYLSETRDKYEKNLINIALKQNIPLLGICRGMQIIGDFFNASFETRNNHISKRHKIISAKSSKYFEFLNKIEEVNSFHKYCIKDISDDFIISARSDDNSVEAIEHKNYKIFAQMWHPEREEPFNQFEIDLIKAFLFEFRDPG